MFFNILLFKNCKKYMNKYTIPKGSLISYMSNKVKSYGGINLAQGIPAFDPPKELIDILINVSSENIHQYAPGNGDKKLLDLLLKYYKKYFNFKRDNFLIVNGGTEAISLLYLYLDKKIKKPYSALAFTPTYETYKNLPPIFGADFIPFEIGEDIDFDNLENSIIKNNVKIMFLSSPGNPYGKIFSENQINKIIKLSLKLNFYVIFDAVYKDLYYKNEPFQPIENFNENLFYINSFSKMLSITGWRIGYLIAHENHIADIRQIHDYTGLCAPSLLQRAIAEYLEKYDFGADYVMDLRKKLKASFNVLSEGLKKIGFKIPDIDGGYFIWAELPDGFEDGFKFAIDLYENYKVAVIPGIHFSDNSKRFIRFNIAQNVSDIQLALLKIKCFCEEILK